MDMTNRIQVFGSLSVCHIWAFLKWWFLTPCRLAATRSTATATSRRSRNRAVDGRSGMKARNTRPQTKLIAPKMRNTYIHCGRPDVMWPMA